MSERGDWTTPQGWGPPEQAPAVPPLGPPGAEPPPGHGATSGYGPPAGYRPDVKPGVVPLRPLGLGELLDGAVSVLRRYPRPTLGLAAAVAIVSTLFLVALQLTVFRPLLEVTTSPTVTAEDVEAVEDALGGAAVGGLLAAVITVLSTAVLTGMLTAVVGKAVLGQEVAFGEVWRQVRPLLLKLVGVALLLVLVPSVVLLVGVVVGSLLIALLGPVGLVVGLPVLVGGVGGAIYLYFRWSLAPCALVLERLGVGRSLSRSWLLVKGDWWRVFGISLLAFVVVFFVSLVIQVPFELLGYGSFSDLASGGEALTTRSIVASAIGGILAATLVDPFSAGVRALLYVDRRMRAEGLDVALTAAADGRA